jgi:hypothetical protein
MYCEKLAVFRCQGAKDALRTSSSLLRLALHNSNRVTSIEGARKSIFPLEGPLEVVR